MNATKLVFAAWESTHALVGAIEGIEHCQGMRGKRLFYDKIADAAILALAYVSSTGGHAPQDLVARLDYISELGRARESLIVAKGQIENVGKRGYISTEKALELMEKCDEVSGLLLLLSMEMRRNGRR